MNTHEFLFAQNWVEQFRAEVHKNVSEGIPLLYTSYSDEAHGDSLFRLIDAHYVDVFMWDEGLLGDYDLWGRRQRTCCDQTVREKWAGYLRSAVLDSAPLTR